MTRCHAQSQHANARIWPQGHEKCDARAMSTRALQCTGRFCAGGAAGCNRALCAAAGWQGCQPAESTAWRDAGAYFGAAVQVGPEEAIASDDHRVLRGALPPPVALPGERDIKRM